MSDPTRADMLAFLLRQPYCASEADDFAIESAIYWYANDYHSGQWSNLYAALCASDYHPGACERGPDSDSVAGWLYDALEAEFNDRRGPFCVTYDIVTEESAEYGDAAERGYIARYVPLREAIAAVGETRTSGVGGVTSVECDSCPAVAPRWVTVTNGLEYETGDVESRSLHMPDNLTPATRRRIARLLGAYGVAEGAL